MEPVRAEIDTTGANLRKGRGMSWGVEDQLALHDIVAPLEVWTTPSWVKVRVIKTSTGIAVGKVGYIWSTELRLLPPTPDTGPVPMPAPTPEPPYPPFKPMPTPPVATAVSGRQKVTMIIVSVIAVCTALVYMCGG